MCELLTHPKREPRSRWGFVLFFTNRPDIAPDVRSDTGVAPGPYAGSGASGLFYRNLYLCAAGAQCLWRPGAFRQDLGEWGRGTGNEAVQVKK